MKFLKKLFSYFFIFLLGIFYPSSPVFAANGDNAVFSFAPLNGKTGENEVKLVVNTDGALINHLIFDIVNTAVSFFDIDGSDDPVSFPLSGQSILGTETPFTTASGDKGYDLASSNPVNTSSYTALNFATLIADKNLANGAGGTLAFDTDTAIYVNAGRKGTFGSSYAVLANVAPLISIPKIDGQDLSGSTVQPSSSVQMPPSLLTNVSTLATFTYSVTDNSDASVQRVAKLYKRTDGSWAYPSSPTKTITFPRISTNMTFSYTLSASEALDFSSYYKLEYIATDDQGAADIDTFYFATTADNIAPVQVSKAIMTFMSDSNTRSDVVAQISFLASSDNGSVGNYYLWTKSYLVAKNILNSNGTRHLNSDTNADGNVSDSEFYVKLRMLVNSSNYISSMTVFQAGNTPYMALTGTNVDSFDNNSTSTVLSDDVYYVSTSIAQEIFYIVAADVARTIDGTNVPNFSAFQVVSKFGDVFGAQVDISANSKTYSYMVGDGSLNIWDAVHIYRNAIGRDESYPILMPDMLHTAVYNYPANISRSAATEK